MYSFIQLFFYTEVKRTYRIISSNPILNKCIMLSQSNLQTHAINYFKLEYLAKITHSYLKTQKKCPTQIKATGSSEDQMK